MKRLLILPIISLIGAACFCTGMFSTSDDSKDLSFAITDAPSYIDRTQTDDQLIQAPTEEVPAQTPAPTEPTVDPTIDPDESGSHVVVTTPGFLSGTVLEPEIELPEVTTPEVTTPAVTTPAPVTTTSKPVTTTKKPVTAAPPAADTPETDTSVLDKFLSIVTGEIGVKEKPYNNVKYNTWYYGRTVRASNNESTAYAWCAVFVSWCANQAGIPKSTIPVTASADYYYSWYKNRGQYFKYSAGTPQPGDLIFIDWDKRHGEIDHVGIVVSVENGIVTTVEGNYSNRVSCNTYSLNSGYIVGYGRPNYN